MVTTGAFEDVDTVGLGVLLDVFIPSRQTTNSELANTTSRVILTVKTARARLFFCQLAWVVCIVVFVIIDISCKTRFTLSALGGRRISLRSSILVITLASGGGVAGTRSQIGGR